MKLEFETLIPPPNTKPSSYNQQNSLSSLISRKTQTMQICHQKVKHVNCFDGCKSTWGICSNRIYILTPSTEKNPEIWFTLFRVCKKRLHNSGKNQAAFTCCSCIMCSLSVSHCSLQGVFQVSKTANQIQPLSSKSKLWLTGIWSAGCY